MRALVQGGGLHVGPGRDAPVQGGGLHPGVGPGRDAPVQFKEDRSILALAQAGKWRLKVQQLKNSRFSDKFDEKNEPFKDAGGRLGVS